MDLQELKKLIEGQEIHEKGDILEACFNRGIQTALYVIALCEREEASNG